MRFVEASHAMLLFGVLLVNPRPGNLVVRLVLASTGALRPADINPAPPSTPGTGPAAELRGGRLLGPKERLLIVGLGLAGQNTAAGLVIAAKGSSGSRTASQAQRHRGDSGADRPGDRVLPRGVIRVLALRELTSLVSLGLVE